MKSLGEFAPQARTSLGRFIGQVLEADRKFIESNFYFAWDPLAAMALVEPAVVTTRPMAIEVCQNLPEEARTAEVAGHRPNAQVACDANASALKKVFFRAFAR
ncbi:MAG TPA: hypothetical protein VF953_03680 [Terriglobales bacterium]